MPNAANERDRNRLWHRFVSRLSAPELAYINHDAAIRNLAFARVTDALVAQWNAWPEQLENNSGIRDAGPFRPTAMQRAAESAMAEHVLETWRLNQLPGFVWGARDRGVGLGHAQVQNFEVNWGNIIGEDLDAPGLENGQMIPKKSKPVVTDINGKTTVDEAFLGRGDGNLPRDMREGMLLSLPPKSFPHEHCVGLEVEVEGLNYVQNSPTYRLVQEGWQIINDGSLRNGREFITRLGMLAGDVLSYTEPLEVLLKNSSFSFRCGLHVHIDATKHSMEDLYKLFMVYSVVEPILFEISGRRYKNKFCCAVQDSKNSVSSAIYYGQQRDWTQFAGVVGQGTKYMAMNILPLTSYGSVEFRHHEGTAALASISKWVGILTDLCCVVKGQPCEDVEIRLMALNTNSEYDRFLQKQFPNSFQSLMIPDYRKLMYPGVMYIKECFASEPEYVAPVKLKFRRQ